MPDRIETVINATQYSDSESPTSSVINQDVIASTLMLDGAILHFTLDFVIWMAVKSYLDKTNAEYSHRMNMYDVVRFMNLHYGMYHS